MTRCDYCGKRINELPFHCKFCGKEHCSNHRLPEEHKCKELIESKKHNQERWSKAIIGTQKHSYKKFKGEHHKKQDKELGKNKLGFLEKTKRKTNAYASNLFYDVKSWLKHRDCRKYSFANRSNYLLSIVLGFVISIVAFIIIYSNIEKLNEIKIWIIKIGGVLLLTSLFFTIKYGYKLLKEAFNLLKRQRNWIKYLIMILFLLLLWQAYTNKDTVLNPVFDIYNNTNFSYFAPLSFGNFSFESNSNPSSTYSNANKEGSSLGDFVQGVFDPKSQIDISELEQEVHRRINTERTNNGLSPLNWDSKIVKIARDHSEDMVTRNFYSHDNPDGEDPTGRGNRQGYPCTKDYGSYYTYGLAENIAITPIYSNVVGCGSTTSLNSLAECIVDGWMTSPGHRENILTGTYTKTGIGIAYSNDDEAYSTQNFC